MRLSQYPINAMKEIPARVRELTDQLYIDFTAAEFRIVWSGPNQMTTPRRTIRQLRPEYPRFLPVPVTNCIRPTVCDLNHECGQSVDILFALSTILTAKRIGR